MHHDVQMLLSALVGATLLQSPWASADNQSSDGYSEPFVTGHSRLRSQKANLPKVAT